MYQTGQVDEDPDSQASQGQLYRPFRSTASQEDQYQSRVDQPYQDQNEDRFVLERPQSTSKGHSYDQQAEQLLDDGSNKAFLFNPEHARNESAQLIFSK